MPKVFASFSVLVGLVFAMATGPAIGGSQLAEPEGRVILTISGAIDRTNGDALARFDRKMLEVLGTTTITTSTSWTDGPQEFEGGLARDVLKAVGANGGTIAATAPSTKISGAQLVAIGIAEITVIT